MKISKIYLILASVLFLTFIFRLPSLFEPYWYGDEGIFAAVARNLNQGGTLYQTAWDNKPPMIYFTYQLIFKILGVSMFNLRLVTAIVALATCAVVYEIAQAVIGARRALLAALLVGFLSSLRIVEGNLALTEIFMVLPIAGAMLISIKRNFDFFSLFVAGFLLAIASLYKQVGGLEVVALGIFLFLRSKDFGEFFKKGVFLSIGFILPFLAVLAYFAPKNLVGEYIFAAYTYYRIYLGESPRYALFINILKFLPIMAVIFYGLYKRHRQEIGVLYLFLLWLAFSFLGSYFSGRTYGHYLIQAIPAFSLILASVSIKPNLKFPQVIFALFFFVPLIFLTRLLFTNFLSGGPINQLNYWRNFGEFAFGKKGLNSYNDYFDKNVNSIMALSDFFSVESTRGTSVYIWGDYPWLYAIADLENPTRYVTSFHVFGVPNGKEEVVRTLSSDPPKYIIKPPSSIGYFSELEKLLSKKYMMVATIENSDVYTRRNESK